MTSSFLISNQELANSTSTSASESKRKKRRQIHTSLIIKNNNQSENPKNKSQADSTTWKSASEHKIYASKLVDALRRRKPDCTVRETADRVLALSAKGRSRWSRTIITNRLKLQLRMIKHKNKRKNTKVAATKQSKNLVRRPPVKKRLLAVQEKARDLSRLVPGCRKMTFPNLLDEVSDYIAALEMQVLAMTALTGLLTSSNQSI
ncbi:transcription factor bHLH149-like [Apium graveolens]|uniref:transcription factor bHLH149-like n=1 Tax=Apium graveolens TaxID=4045 RepID=UPI003D7BC760